MNSVLIYFHISHEEIEAYRHKTCPSHIANKWQSQDLNPGSLAPDSMHLTSHLYVWYSNIGKMHCKKAGSALKIRN